MSKNGKKTTSLMMPLTKKQNLNPKNFLPLQTQRIAKSFKGLNSSLAQLAEELCRETCLILG